MLGYDQAIGEATARQLGGCERGSHGFAVLKRESDFVQQAAHRLELVGLALRIDRDQRPDGLYQDHVADQHEPASLPCAASSALVR